MFADSLWQNRLTLASAVAATLVVPTAQAQAPQPPAPQQRLNITRNFGAVGIISGGPGGTYIQMATDLSFIHDDLTNYTLRIVPMVGRGSVQNIDDLLFLRGVDFAIVQEDVLAHFALTEAGRRKSRQIRYVTKLHNEEVHVLAHRRIASIADLAGRKVSIGAAGSGHALTADVLLRRYRLNVDRLSLDPAVSLAKLRAGEIDAMIYVAGKPVSLFQNLKRSDQVHFLAVDEPSLRDIYADALLTPTDYRDLLDAPVKTVMVAAVLAAFGGFEEGSDRAKKSCAFVDKFLEKAHELRLPGRHPKWAEVDIRAEVKNWQRLGCAAEWLRRNQERGPCVAGKVDPVFLNIYRENLMDRYPGMRDTLKAWPEERLLQILKEDRQIRSQDISCLR